MGKKSQTVKQTTAPPPYIQQAQQGVIGAAQGLAQQPLQQYGGPQVAGFTPAQFNAFNTINGAQGIANPYLNLGAQYTANAANSIADQTPLLGQGATSGLAGTAYNTFTNGPSDILGVGTGAVPGLTNTVNQSTLGYMNPYTQQVVQATLAQMNNQDQQQQNQLVGNAVAAGAWGGDRAGVAQGVLGGQQALARDQTIANILSQGYGQAQQTALGTVGQGINAAAQQNQFGLQYGTAAQQAYATQLQAAQQAASQQGLLNLYAGQQFGGLGSEALQNTLAGANAQFGIGQQQQALAQQQLNVPLGMFQQQQAYPYQQLQYLSGIINGSNVGSTTTGQQPAGSLLGQLGGAGLALAGSGAFGNSGWLTGAGGLFGSAAAPTTSSLWGTIGMDALAAAKRGGAIGMDGGGAVKNYDRHMIPLIPDIGYGATNSIPDGVPLGPVDPRARLYQRAEPLGAGPSPLMEQAPWDRGTPYFHGHPRPVTQQMADGGSPDDTLEFLNTRQLFGNNPLFASGGDTASSVAPGKGFDGVATDVGIMRTPSGAPQMSLPMLPTGAPQGLPLGTSPVSNFTPQPNAYAPVVTPTHFGNLNPPLSKVNDHSTRNMWDDIGMALVGGIGSIFGLERGGKVPHYDDGGDVYADYRQRQLANAMGLPIGGGMPSPTETVSGIFHYGDNPADVPPQPVSHGPVIQPSAYMLPRNAAPPAPRPLGAPPPMKMEQGDLLTPWGGASSMGMPINVGAPRPLGAPQAPQYEYGDLLTPWSGGSGMETVTPESLSHDSGPHNVAVQHGQSRPLGHGVDVTVQPDQVDPDVSGLTPNPPQLQTQDDGTGTEDPTSGMNLPLMAMGLGMMSSRGNLGQAIGKGGMEALQAMGSQRQYAFEQRKEAAEEKYRQQEIETMGKRLDVELEHYQEMYGLGSEKNAETRRWHDIEGSINEGREAAYADVSAARAENLRHGVPNKPMTWNEAQTWALKAYHEKYPSTNGVPWSDPETGAPPPDVNVWTAAVAGGLLKNDPYAQAGQGGGGGGGQQGGNAPPPAKNAGYDQAHSALATVDMKLQQHKITQQQAQQLKAQIIALAKKNGLNVSLLQ